MRKIFIFIFVFNVFLLAQNQNDFITLNSTGVESFLNSNPFYDGRGTVIFIFDTGVDVGIDGLKFTSTGETKIIDVKDFSHQGDINLYDAKIVSDSIGEKLVNKDISLSINGISKIGLKATNNKYFIGFVNEKIWQNSNKLLEDINGNGKTDDKFLLTVFETEKNGEKFWVTYIDLNNDGDLSDEKPIRCYKDKFDFFEFKREDNKNLLNIALNIFPEKNLLSIHFDDGAHGSHCAGISSGYKISTEDFNGVAPGAKIISCKIGDNRISSISVTESIKNAFIFADDYSKKNSIPCIINMSYGIGTEIEDKSEIEDFINKLSEENPYLYICLSASNEGPGISSIGLPSAAHNVISSGAVLTKEVGNNIYNTNLDKDIILHFSSRGGDSDKPNVIAPGAAASTVPGFRTKLNMWGTSMASPYTAGVMSLLLSATKVEFPNTKIPSSVLYKAIINSAVKMDDYKNLEQGNGYLNVPKAFELLEKYINNGEIKNNVNYDISSLAPNLPLTKGNTLYIRDGSFIKDDDIFSFTVNRKSGNNESKINYKLKSENDWLITIQESLEINNNEKKIINVKIDTDEIENPGLYNSKIIAYRDDENEFNDFELNATIIIPHKFSEENNYKINVDSENLKVGEFKRYFLSIPSGSSALRIKLSSINNYYSRAKLYLYDFDGQDMGNSILLKSNDNKTNDERYFYNLSPGVYELIVNGYFDGKKESKFNLEMELFGLQNLLSADYSNNKNELKIINNLSKKEEVDIEASILGNYKKWSFELIPNLTYVKEFVMFNSDLKKTFELSVSKEDYGKLTDMYFGVIDENNKEIESTTFNQKEELIVLNNEFEKDSVKLRLIVVTGFANSDSKISCTVVEKTEFENPISVEIDYSTKQNFFPLIQRDLQLKFPDENFEKSKKYYGEVNFNSTINKNSIYKLPITFSLMGE